jgi:hypothetical protein
MRKLALKAMSIIESQTTTTFSSGFDDNRTYSFRVYAVSSSGAWSRDLYSGLLNRC